MKINTWLPLAGLLLAGAFQAGAQQRTCDMDITLISPAESAVIGAFTQFNVTVGIVNNGPSALVAGDTLYYHTSSMLPLDTRQHVLSQGIAVGENATITLEVVTNNNDNNYDETSDYCIEVISNPQDNGSFIDTTNDQNNFDCNSVTIRAGNPVSVAHVINGEGAVRLFPNPAADELNLDLSGIARAAGSYHIRDISGRLVAAGTFGRDDQRVKIALPAMQRGLYFLDLQCGDYRATGKFVKR